MLIRKTSSKKRQTYTYKFDDGENIKSYILESGKDGVTKEHIKLLHSLDDAEIYNNLKNVHPAQEEWQKDLIAKTNMTSSTMAKLGKNQAVSMEVLARICDALDCNIGDIVDVIKEK